MQKKVLFEKRFEKLTGFQIINISHRGFGDVLFESVFKRAEDEECVSNSYSYMDNYEPSDAMRIGFALIRGGLLEALNNLFKRENK